MTATGGVVKATLTGDISLEGKVESESTLSPNNSSTTTLPAVLSAEGSLKAANAVEISFSRKWPAPGKVLRLSAEANISYKNLEFATYRLGSLTEISTNVYGTLKNFEVSLESKLSPTYLDRFAGNFGDFECQEKLYPSGDLAIDSDMGEFVGPFLESGNLYTFIDEGIFTGDYDAADGNSTLVSDETTYIHPDTYKTEGLFQYKCGLTNFRVKPDETRFRVRASAPMSNYESNIPPRYTIQEIKFSDPSGNLIVQYEDIVIKGDAEEYLGRNNFATYSSQPKINSVSSYDWQRLGNPHLHEVSGYTLSFNVKAEALDEAFDTGFEDLAFEDYPALYESVASGNDYLALDGAPLSTQNQSLINPTKNIKISAIEICNSGGEGPRVENYVSLFAKNFQSTRVIERKLLPSFMPTFDFDTGIVPYVSSIWYNRNESFSNLDSCGASEVLKGLQQDTTHDYATLDTIGPHLDSGKLVLKFSHSNDETNEITAGAFGCAFDQNICPIWFNPSGAFDTQRRTPLGTDNSFFVVESVTLKVKAKKAVGSRDYNLDVVGYSDDGLLSVTSSVGGFLQHPSGVQINDNFISATDIAALPVSSGFVGNDDLGISTTSLSEKEQYFESSGINPGHDHYSYLPYQTVTSTTFEDYEIPLKVHEDKVTLGRSQDYRMSSNFEHLYLDIYSLPSGASIASAYLLVRYAPQNAFNLTVRGGENTHLIGDSRSEGKLLPVDRQSNDNILNAGSGYNPLSTIENIPHAYTTPSSIKSNYSRRWRGMEGTVSGPFDVEMFGHGFYNPRLDFPFLSGYFDFDYLGGRYVKSRPLVGDFGTASGLANHDLEIYQNVGWRFSSGTLFNDELPGFSGNYKTTDWTSLSNGGTTFVGNPMYGKIADAFNNVARISGAAQSINFGNIDTTSGFSIFARFTPDANVSGVGYDLFNSGVLYAKWDSATQLDFALGYSGGYLCGYAQDKDGNIISVADTIKYSGYQFPLNTILTYNDHQSSGLKLYTDNELYQGTFTTLRASSSPFYKNTTSADLVLGYAAGSGVGMNMLVSEFGISTWSSGVEGSGTNIVEANADKTYKQVTAQKFLENSRAKFFDPGESYSNDSYKLWDYVNEDTRVDWTLGDFKHCPFSLAFSQVQKKPFDRDLIAFNIKHDGAAYSTNNDLVFPASVNSGVSYHTQLENDFLRFHLSDTPDSFYSTHRRITKTLPRGYKFSDRALVVETVIEHETDHDIVWPNCTGTIGPKLIVSLYTTKQEPYWTTSEPNWGLVNRDIHYLEPSSCLMRIDSKFTYDSLLNNSENWALFPNETKTKDFKERYFSQDVDDMFLQYDLVYPSGPSYESRINIHTAHVRMDDALINRAPDSGIMTLNTSGNLRPQAYLNLNFPYSGFPSSGLLTLNTLGPILVQESGFILNVSGEQRPRETVPLYSYSSVADSGIMTLNVSGLKPTQYISQSLITGGAGSRNIVVTYPGNTEPSLIPEVAVYDAASDTYIVFGNIVETFAGNTNPALLPDGVVYDPATDTYLLYNQGETLCLNVSGAKVEAVQMPLHLVNTDTSYDAYGPTLPLFAFASNPGTIGNRATMPINLENNHFNSTATSSFEQLSLYNFGSNRLENRYPSGSMSLYTFTPTPPPQVYASDSISIILAGDELETIAASSSMNLYARNFDGKGIDFFYWTNENFGSSIDVADNVYASVSADNEIRGVDLIGYGTCDGTSTAKAVDPAIITDEVTWRQETCNNGGILRAVNTYTNPTASGFGDSVGYSGNYYGIRQFSNLMPSHPYSVTLKVTTGSTERIKVPRTFEDWEYGICGPDFGANACCTADCEQNLGYSGVKLIGDYPYLDGNASITPPSGRNAGDNYGRSVSVMGDLMAVGSPALTVPDEDGNALPNAGAVFLYRRGADVPGTKANWQMEDKLMLPSGFRRDYYTDIEETLLTYDEFSVSGRKWDIGQEGRQLGHSVAVCSSGDRETVVVGAPNAAWTRTFEDPVMSGVYSCMIVIVDKFEFNSRALYQIRSTAERYKNLYKYFSAPWNAGGSEFQADLENKILVCQLTNQKDHQGNPTNRPEVYNGYDWFRHVYVDRLDDASVENTDTALDGMLDSLKKTFFELFPSGKALPHSGIPPILGIFSDISPSVNLGMAWGRDRVGGSLVDKFVDFYESYAEESGVVKSYVKDGAITTEARKGYVNEIQGVAESWSAESLKLVDTTLTTGNLINTHDGYTNYVNNLHYITSGVGQEWANANAYRFNIPPSSGGRVFVFEKENGVFNCIQTIETPSDRNADHYIGIRNEYNDRYGHSVAISNNSEIISVGSPYIDTACEIFERDDSEITRMYNRLRDWLVHKELTDKVTRYDTLLDSDGVSVAQTTVYNELSPSEKFDLRQDQGFWGRFNTIQTYKPIYDYSYSDVSITGTWQFIPNTFLGTSRLGYSTAVNDDGSIVAFGAPTDSMNEFEDSNVWYKGKNAWASHTNAGAVRMFESKKYYPHSGVVEYTRFGNLDRNYPTHKTELEAGHYDEMGTIFDSSVNPFRRTQFEELDIPTDAGLAFIITPEIDAASDEIIDNIKSWLTLGDRTLVLVGNDPNYEENGIYKTSNEILNKILSKLGSRMRIHGAQTEEESLPGCADVATGRYNVIASFVPEYAHTSLISTNNIYAKGVGDIRIDTSDLGNDILDYQPCGGEIGKLNSICNMPLRDGGDLRAQWQNECASEQSGPDGEPLMIPYKTNWPEQFGNTNPSHECKGWTGQSRYGKPYQDIRPILTSAKWQPSTTTTIPQQEEEVKVVTPVYETVTNPTARNEFALEQEDHIQFAVSGDGLNHTIGKNSKLYLGTASETNFFNPDITKTTNYDADGSVRPDHVSDSAVYDDTNQEWVHTRDGILQSKAISKAGTPRVAQRLLLEQSNLAVQEEYVHANTDGSQTDTGSVVVLLASVLGETNASMTDGDGNQDQNINFYANLVCKDGEAAGKFGGARIAQLGDWTGRDSFTSAYSESELKNRLIQWGRETTLQDLDADGNNDIQHNISIQENASFATGANKIYIGGSNDPDVIWIANPIGEPSEGDVNLLKQWMNQGGKKLIVTYSAHKGVGGTNGNDDSANKAAQSVETLCKLLGIKSTPVRQSNGDWYTQGYWGWNLYGDPNSYTKIELSNMVGHAEYNEYSTQKINQDVDAIKGRDLGFDWKPTESSKVDKLSLKSSAFELDTYIPISGGPTAQQIIYYEDPIKENYNIPTTDYMMDSLGSGVFTTEPGSGYRVFFNWTSEFEREKYDLSVTVRNVVSYPTQIGEEQYLADRPNTIVISKKTEYNLGEVRSDYIDIETSKESSELVIEFNTDKYSNKIWDYIEEGTTPHTPRLLSISGCPLAINTVVNDNPFQKWVRNDITYETRIIPEQTVVTPEVLIPFEHANGIYCNPLGGCDDKNKETLIEDGPVIVAEEFEHFSAGLNGNERSRIVVVTDSTIIQGQCPEYRAVGGSNRSFIQSLYPSSPNYVAPGRQFSFTQKIRSPEVGSPAKYYAASGVDGITRMFGSGGIYGNLTNYVDNEDSYDPSNPGFTRDANEPTQWDEVEAKIKAFYDDEVVSRHGMYPKFSGDFLDIGNNYVIGDADPVDYIVDAGKGGGIPDLMKITGRDYLDFDIYNSGHPGDLFGFSVDMTEDQLIVGTPFNAFHIEESISGVSGVVPWASISGNDNPERSGLRVSANGGAGAAFYFERTNQGKNAVSQQQPWEFKTKIKPSSVNIGLDDAGTVSLQLQRGDHSLVTAYIQQYAQRTDQFGYSVAIDSDMMAIGAPNHDFETLHHHIYSGTSAFQRKSFNAEFTIPGHSYYDLGSSGIRYDKFNDNSGVMVLNNGAVFTFRNEITNWKDQTKEWQYAEKINAQGYNDRTTTDNDPGGIVTQSGCENDSFGRSVSINRAKRGDSDYTLAVGSPNHDFATSGNHSSSGLLEAGAAYIYDAMLREQIPNLPNAANFIDVEVFGSVPSDENKVSIRVYQNTTGESISYTATGLVYPTTTGDIFIEASGFDPVTKGFVAHRPFVESVVGQSLPATISSGSMGLFAPGTSHEVNTLPSGMSLFITTPDSANVYNNMSLYAEVCSGLSSGTLPLYVMAPSGLAASGMNLFTKHQPTLNNLNLRVRGV